MIGKTNTVECTTLAPLFGGGDNDRKLICCGYANALKGLCNKFDIPCVIIDGFTDAQYAHSWNYVQMEDGNWYAVDETWNHADNPMYFLLGKNSVPGKSDPKPFIETHIPEKGIGFYVSLIDGTFERIMLFPELSEEAYKHS